MENLHAVFKRAGLFGLDRKSAAADCGRAFSAASRVKVPAASVVHVLFFGKLGVADIVSFRVWLAQDDDLFGHRYVFVVFLLLVDAHVVNDEPRVFGEFGVLFGVSDPSSADGKVQDEVKMLVKGRGIRTPVSVGARPGEPFVGLVVKLSVDVPAEFARIPFQGVNMEFLGKVAFFQSVFSLLLSVRLSVVNRSKNALCFVAKHFHDVNLAASGPGAVITFA